MQAQSLRSSWTGVPRRGQLRTCHPRGGKLWAHVQPPPSGRRSPLSRQQGFTNGRCYRGGRTPRCYAMYRNKSILLVDLRMRTHKLGSTCGQAAQTETGQLLPLPWRASATTSLVRDRPLTSTATNLPPSRWNALGVSGRRQRPDRSGSGQHTRRDGRRNAFFQIICVTTQVAISRKFHRYRLALKGRQAARGREEEARGLWPMAWGENVDED